jgi:hypothetical protein
MFILIGNVIKVSIKTLTYKHKYVLKDNKLSSDNKQSSNLLLKWWLLKPFVEFVAS